MYKNKKVWKIDAVIKQDTQGKRRHECEQIKCKQIIDQTRRNMCAGCENWEKKCQKRVCYILYYDRVLVGSEDISPVKLFVDELINIRKREKS